VRGLVEKVETSVVVDIAVPEIWKRLEGDQQALLAKSHACAGWAFVEGPGLYTCNRDEPPVEGGSLPLAGAADLVKRPDAALAGDGLDDTEIFPALRWVPPEGDSRGEFGEASQR
jgi:hypothetical protein